MAPTSIVMASVSRFILVHAFPGTVGWTRLKLTPYMKTAKRHAEPQGKKTDSIRKSNGTIVTIPPEARRSTAAALLKYAPGWTGDDLDEVISIVKNTRTKTRF